MKLDILHTKNLKLICFNKIFHNNLQELYIGNYLLKIYKWIKKSNIFIPVK